MTAAGAVPRAARIQRRRRRMMGALFALLLLVLGGADVAVALHPEQVRRRLERSLARTFACEVALHGVDARWDGTLRLASVAWWPAAGEGAGVSGGGAGARQGAGDAGPPAASHAADVRIRLSRPELLRGRLVIEEVEIGAVETSALRVQQLLEALRGGPGGGAGGGSAGGQGGGRVAVADSAVIRVRRLDLDRRGAELPLLRRLSAPRITLERLRLVAARRQREVWRADMVYRSGQLTRLFVRARLDIAAGRVTTWFRASNVEARDRLADALPPDAQRWLAELRPAGPVDLDVEAEVAWADPGTARVRGEVACYTLSVRPRWVERPITNIRGRMRLDGSALRIEGLRGRSDGAEVHLRGSVADVGALAGVDLELGAREAPLAELARALGGAGIARLDLRGTGSLTLRLRSGAGEPLSEARVDGEVELAGAAALGGVLRGLEGSVAIERPRPADAGGERLPRLRARVASAQAFGLSLRQVGCVLVERDGALAIDGLTASLGSGALTGWARLGPADGQLDLAIDGRVVRLAALGEALLPLARAEGVADELRVELSRAAAGRPLLGRVEARVSACDLLALPEARGLAARLAAVGLAAQPFQGGRVTVELAPDGARLDADLVAQSYVAQLSATRAPTGALRGEVAFRKPGSLEVLLRVEVRGTAAAPRFR